MKLLADAGFPKTIHHLPNPGGIVVDRVDSGASDAQLIDLAASEGYRAIVLLGPDIAATTELVTRAERQGVALLCSVTDDPFEAEVNLRRVLESLPSHLSSAAGGLWWLRRDGVRPDVNSS